MQTVETSVTTARHPLDPLTPAEIEAASSALKRARGLADSARFVYVTLREPPKEAVLSFREGDPIDREATVLLRERKERRTYEAVVSVTTGEVRSWRELTGVQPPIMFEEFLASEDVVKKDPRWQEALLKRGITDFENVMIDPWSLGYNGPDDVRRMTLRAPRPSKDWRWRRPVVCRTRRWRPTLTCGWSCSPPGKLRPWTRRNLCSTRSTPRPIRGTR